LLTLLVCPTDGQVLPSTERQPGLHSMASDGVATALVRCIPLAGVHLARHLTCKGAGTKSVVYLYPLLRLPGDTVFDFAPAPIQR